MGAPTYDWARYLAPILKPPTAQTPRYVYSLATFGDEIKRVTIDDVEVMISYDAASLYTKVPRQHAPLAYHIRGADALGPRIKG